ncbi:serine/arginine repetitive matrix protein 1-like [Schistocerca americana]|uniref:serine/arginine repetitive matrix protein 1-like n=1 Tax=Schistocerca americana TaxID=7009 RepID=UPI001F502C9B|nr:serine/arginine repetitive matrix protein 1-like [Schistocerca americana]
MSIRSRSLLHSTAHDRCRVASEYSPLQSQPHCPGGGSVSPRIPRPQRVHRARLLPPPPTCRPPAALLRRPLRRPSPTRRPAQRLRLPHRAACRPPAPPTCRPEAPPTDAATAAAAHASPRPAAETSAQRGLPPTCAAHLPPTDAARRPRAAPPSGRNFRAMRPANHLHRPPGAQRRRPLTPPSPTRHPAQLPRLPAEPHPTARDIWSLRHLASQPASQPAWEMLTDSWLAKHYISS